MTDLTPDDVRAGARRILGMTYVSQGTLRLNDAGIRECLAFLARLSGDDSYRFLADSLCPHCGEAFPGRRDIIPTHDFPRPGRAVCPGSGLEPASTPPRKDT